MKVKIERKLGYASVTVDGQHWNLTASLIKSMIPEAVVYSAPAHCLYRGQWEYELPADLDRELVTEDLEEIKDRVILCHQIAQAAYADLIDSDRTLEFELPAVERVLVAFGDSACG